MLCTRRPGSDPCKEKAEECQRAAPALRRKIRRKSHIPVSDLWIQGLCKLECTKHPGQPWGSRQVKHVLVVGFPGTNSTISKDKNVQCVGEHAGSGQFAISSWQRQLKGLKKWRARHQRSNSEFPTYQLCDFAKSLLLGLNFIICKMKLITHQPHMG